MKNVSLYIYSEEDGKVEQLFNPAVIPRMGEYVSINRISGKVVKVKHVFTDGATSKTDQTVTVYVDEYK